MNTNLERTFAHWVEEVAVPNADIVQHEIANRVNTYPLLQVNLAKRPVDIIGFAQQAEKCTIVSLILKYTSSAYHRVFEDSPQTQHDIIHLIDYLPDSSELIAGRIDEFVAQAFKRSELPKADVALLGSLILTTTYPDQFVDFPSTKTWTHFAQALEYGVLDGKPSHGERIMWASTLAKHLINTEIFNQHWKREFAHPMWVISALNWTYKRISNRE